MSNLHILIIPSWYPVPQKITSGIYFQEQAKSIAKYDLSNKIGVLSAVYLSSLLAVRTKNFNYGFTKIIQDNFSEYIFNFPAIPKTQYINRRIASFVAQKLFLKYIRENGIPDIIHLHSFNMGELAVWAHNKYNISYIYTEHASAFYYNMITSKDKKIVDSIVEKSYSNFAVSSHLARLLSKMFNVKFEVVPNFINTNFFKCENKNKERQFTFVNIAGFYENKNHMLLLKAFRKFYLKYPNSTLFLYGEGPEETKMKTLAKELNIQNAITFGGRADRKDIKNQLCKSHCFVLTSRYETFGVVTIEAMSCGLVTISTKNGGSESIITNNTLGLLCDQDVNSFFNAMEKIYISYNNYDRDSIREYVVKNFSEISITSNILDIYSNVIKQINDI